MIQPISGNQQTPPKTTLPANQPPKGVAAGTSKTPSTKTKPGVTATFSQAAQIRAKELLESKFQEASESGAQKATEAREPASPQSLIGGGK